MNAKKEFNYTVIQERDENLNSKIKNVLINNSDSDKAPYNRETVARLINENKDGKSDVGNFIWMVLVLKKWFDAKS